MRSTNSAKDPRLLCLKKGIIKLEVPPRFELGIAALQAAALPLGDGTSQSITNGARGRTWTGTVLLPGDFKSPASTDFATRALGVYQQFIILNGAGNEVRTRDPNLGKVVLYHWAIPAIFYALSF